MANIVNDSRAVVHGDTFVLEENALRFLSQALLKGPSMIVVHKKIETEARAVIANQCEVVFYSERSEIIDLLQERYGLPSHICAVTGTNGKTSVAAFVFQMWSLLGVECLSIGTMGVSSSKKLPTAFAIENTTPSVFMLYQMLDQAKLAGIEHVIMEASSHGLHQGRMDGLVIERAALTNLTQDHLDYHGNMQSYGEAKALLFSKFLQGRAILNADIPEFSYFKSACGKNPYFEYGFAGKDIKIVSANFVGNGFDVALVVLGQEFRVFFPVIAMFQVYNICATIGFFLHNYSPALTVEKIPLLRPPAGRMEEVLPGSNVYVDYAHTPDALEKALLTLRAGPGRDKLVVVFGCGGNRDAAKRPIMGGIAASLADVAIVTDDNPRNEDAHDIRAQVLAGVPADLVHKAINLPDRLEAIKYAIKNYHQSSAILVAGKGHENYQIIGDTKHHFSDQEEVVKAISATSD